MARVQARGHRPSSPVPHRRRCCCRRRELAERAAPHSARTGSAANVAAASFLDELLLEFKVATSSPAAPSRTARTVASHGALSSVASASPPRRARHLLGREVPGRHGELPRQRRGGSPRRRRGGRRRRRPARQRSGVSPYSSHDRPAERSAANAAKCAAASGPARAAAAARGRHDRRNWRRRGEVVTGPTRAPAGQRAARPAGAAARHRAPHRASRSAPGPVLRRPAGDARVCRPFAQATGHANGRRSPASPRRRSLRIPADASPNRSSGAARTPRP